MAGSRRLQIDIVGDARGLAKMFGETESRLGKFSKSVGRAGLLVGSALGAGAVAGGAALVAIGTTFDNMSDTIRVGTGATGDALKALEESAKRVGTTVPASFDDVGVAIADLNTRTGLTGPALEGLAGQFLELSRITGEDLGGSIESITRVFGDWGQTTEQMPGAMDALFRASQSTGISVGTLSEQLVKFGAPMRQLGFSFETTAGLLGKFEKEGVNAELVMGSMRIALGKMARDGEPAEETLQRVTEEIANAGSASEANALALELFGARAGPDMAAAIREGRFELGDLLDVIEGGSETILDAADDTASWQEQWQLLKNRGMVAFAPLAEKAFSALGDGLEAASPHIEAFGEWMSVRLPQAMAETQEFIEANLVPAFEWLVDWVRTNWPQISDVIGEVADTITEIISAAVELWTAFWEQFGDDILGHVQDVWPEIVQVISGAIDIITGVAQAFSALFRGDWGALWDAVKQIVSGAWDVITGLIGLGVDAAQFIIGAAWGQITTITSDLVTNIVDAIAGIPSALLGLLLSFVGAGYSLGKAILDGFANALAAGASFAGDIAAGVVSAIKSGINSFVIGPINSALEFSIPLGPFGSVNVNPPDIPYLAKGGVADGLAVVGERGPELAVFGRAGRVLSHADSMRAVAGGAGGQPIIIELHVDGRKMARAVADASQRVGGLPFKVRAS